jgi:hypothetical protein
VTASLAVREVSGEPPVPVDEEASDHWREGRQRDSRLEADDVGHLRVALVGYRGPEDCRE